jgi:multidrug/hemolysin transport system ATP-binding protein
MIFYLESLSSFIKRFVIIRWKNQKGVRFMDMIIKVENLKKSYGDLLAVNDVSFDVKRGSLFAFLGPNGAGKSTTINMMTTLLKQDEGFVYLNGKTEADYIRNKIGVVFQENVLDEDLTVKENLFVRGALYLKSKGEIKERYDMLSSFLGLSSYENQRFKTLSGGQKRRAEIARALFSNPEILLLDEPTTGLDPETRQIVWKLILDLKNQKGLTVFLTTHYMEEAANADHVVIINQGKIIVQGTPASLKEKYSKDLLKIVPENKQQMIDFLGKEKISYQRISDQFVISLEDSKDSLEIICQIKENIKSLEVIKGTMDDVFINVIGGENHAGN